MRYGTALVLALALGVMGCSETSGTGGTAGTGGSAGIGGSAGSNGGGGIGGEGGVAGTAGISGTLCDFELCEDVDCDDGDPCTRDVCQVADGACSHLAACDDFNDCTIEACDSIDGSCSAPSPVAEGTPCAGGTCQSGVCDLTDTSLPCSEQGIRNAIAAGDNTYTFTCDGTSPVVTQAEIEIDKNVVLEGAGKLTVDGNCAHRIFSVDEGVVAELRGLTVTQGASARAPGGGIHNRGTLTLVDSTVSENEATCDFSCELAEGYGGGIFSIGNVTLNNSTVSGNRAFFGGGGIVCFGSTATLTDSEVLENDAALGRGGGVLVAAAGSLMLADSTVSGNRAEFSGGGISGTGLTLVNSTVSGNTADRGGGIHCPGGSATLTNSTVSGNTAVADGGGMSQYMCAVTLTDSTVSENTVSGRFAAGGGIHNQTASLTLRNCTVSGNAATGWGGGINNHAGSATLLGSTVSGNTSGNHGGGIQNSNGGVTTLTNSTVSGNTAVSGGGIGGVAEGLLRIWESTLSGNTAELNGGGIGNSGNMLMLSNSTVSGNTADFGGGIYNTVNEQRTGEMMLIGSTVFGNAADERGSAIYVASGGIDVETGSTVIGGDCTLNVDAAATWASKGYNIEGPGNTCRLDQDSDLFNITDLKLGPLADNGGPTMTHAVLPGSDAIDVVPEAECLDAVGTPLTKDQRGEPRPVAILGPEPKCDVGAFEVQP